MRCARMLIVALVATITSPADAQIYLRETDTLFRAAYCVGLLKAAIAWLESAPMQNAAKMSCGPNPYLRPKNLASLSEEECKKAYLEDLRQQHQSKHKRYFDYVNLALLGGLPDGLQTQVLIVVKKGEHDHGRPVASDPNGEKFMQCSRGCLENHDQCLVDCIAKYDQVLANQMACQFLPDKLPY